MLNIIAEKMFLKEVLKFVFKIKHYIHNSIKHFQVLFPTYKEIDKNIKITIYR